MILSDFASPYWRDLFLKNLLLLNFPASFLPIFVKYISHLANAESPAGGFRIGGIRP